MGERKEKLKRLRLNDPLIHAAFTALEMGRCTYEEALEELVINLSESRTELLKKMEKALHG